MCVSWWGVAAKADVGDDDDDDIDTDNDDDDGDDDDDDSKDKINMCVSAGGAWQPKLMLGSAQCMCHALSLCPGHQYCSIIIIISTGRSVHLLTPGLAFAKGFGHLCIHMKEDTCKSLVEAEAVANRQCYVEL